MFPKIDNPHHTRIEMAPRRTSHPRGRPRQASSSTQSPSGRDSSSARHPSSIRRSYSPDRGACSARRGRHYPPPSTKVWAPGCAECFCSRDASRGRRRDDNPRGYAGLRSPLWVALRERVRFSGLLEPHRSPAALQAGSGGGASAQTGGQGTLRWTWVAMLQGELERIDRKMVRLAELRADSAGRCAGCTAWE